MCPKGCMGTVVKAADGIREVTGFTCKRGQEYAREEVTVPKRMLTTTVRIANGELALLPVVSNNLLPKEKIMDCIQVLNKVTVAAPVLEGDVVVTDILELGVDIVASRDISSSL